MPDEPEIEPQCILCREGEHRCDCQECQCEECQEMEHYLTGEACESCGGIVK